MKFICEVCNTKHDTPQAAEQCEQAHEKERAKRMAKEAAAATISNAINAFVARYGEFPEVRLSPENEKVVAETAAQHLERIFSTIADIFCDGDESDVCDIDEGAYKSCGHCGECHKYGHQI